MSRSCQRATSSRPGDEVAAQHPRQADEALGVIGLRLCGIADEPFWPAANGSSDLADLAPLQVADLGRDRLDRRADRGAGVEVLGVAVARDHLGRRHRPQPERARRRAASTAGSMFE